MTQLKFSVLMSLYIKEQADCLSDCLKSLSSQTLAPDETIIVYDGPITEELDKVVRDWQVQLKIKIVPLPENRGLGEALNIGLSHCSNNIVARMDTDDICLPLRFEKQLQYLSLYPDIAVLGSNIVEYDEKMEAQLATRIVPTTTNEIKKRALTHNPFNHVSIVFKKDIIEKVGGYQPHLFMEDYNLWLRVISAGYNVYNLPEILLDVRTGENMLKRRKGLRYIKSERQLAKLKYTLKLQSYPASIGIFLLRSIPRILPTFILKFIYQIIRKKGKTKHLNNNK